MRQRVGGHATKLVLVFASLLLVVAVGELLTLLGYDFRDLFNTPVRYELSRYIETDPELLFRTRSSLHETGIQHGGDIAQMWNLQTEQRSEIHWDVQLDRNGFRNPDTLTSARVAVIGDSFVVGRPVAANQVLTSVLSTLLAVPVVNLGQTGYGPQQELGILRRYALSYQPQVIVWAFFEGNDLNDAVWYERARNQWPAMVAADRAFAKRSLVANALAAAGNVIQPPTESPLARSRWGALPDGRRMWFHHEMGPWTEEQLAALNGVAEIVAEAHRFCAAQSVRFVVLFLPDKFRVYRDACTFADESDCHVWSLNDFPERFLSILQRLAPGIELLDLTPSFRARAVKGDVLFFPDDTHWNAAGHAAAAEVVAAFLQKRQLVQ